MMSPGNIAQPPQPIGSCQPTNVNPLTEAGDATPAHHTGSALMSTPARSRTTPSVTSAATLRFFMRAQRMSPKMPALGTPMASATATAPSGISSMAARVEIGLPQLSGVARSSRAGTKRSVKAGPTTRAPPGTSGFGPLIQQRRIPFFSSIVVIVAVVTLRRISNRTSLIVRPRSRETSSASHSSRRFPFGIASRAQPAGGAVAATVSPIVPMRAVAEIAGVGFGEKKFDKRLAADLVGERERGCLVDPHQRRMNDEAPIHPEPERELH